MVFAASMIFLALEKSLTSARSEPLRNPDLDHTPQM